MDAKIALCNYLLNFNFKYNAGYKSFFGSYLKEWAILYYGK